MSTIDKCPNRLLEMKEQTQTHLQEGIKQRELQYVIEDIKQRELQLELTDVSPRSKKESDANMERWR
jgi:hypothetical protein